MAGAALKRLMAEYRRELYLRVKLNYLIFI